MESYWKIIKCFSSNSISEDLICAICKTILVFAHQGSCGCKYCEECMKSHFIDAGKKCPGGKPECQDKFDEFAIDYETNRRLKHLRVKCLKQSCDVEEELCNIEKHMKICQKNYENCPYMVIGCSQANIDVEVISSHLEKAMLSHSKLLMNYLLSSQKKLENLGHIQVKDMENMKLKFQKEIESLIQESNRNKMKINELNDAMKEGIQRENRKEKEILNLQGRLKETEKKLEEINITLQKKQNPIEESRLFLEQNKNLKLNKRISRYDELFGLNKRISVLENELMRENLYVWKIESFEERMKLAKSGKNESIYSEPFYSSKNGFQIKLKLTLNGYRSAKSKYMSVFFGILKGEYDELTSWPIQDTIIINLINQDTRESHISNTFNFEHTDEKDKVVFDKPDNTDINYYGNYEFIELSEFSIKPYLTKNDAIILTCSVQHN